MLRDHLERNKKPIMCIAARQEHIELNENFDRSSWDHKSITVCNVYVLVPCLIWICRGLSQNRNLEIYGRLRVGDVCKGVLSLPSRMKAAQKCVRSPAALSQTPNSTMARILPFCWPAHLTTVAIFVFKSKLPTDL